MKTSGQIITDMRRLPTTDARTAAERRDASAGDGESLVQWLNAATGTLSQKRIIQLRNELLQLERDFRQAALDHVFLWVSGRVSVQKPGQPPRTLEPDSKSSPASQEKIRRQTELNERHAAIVTALERYSFSISAVFVTTRGEWVSGLVSNHRKSDFVLRTKPYGEQTNLEQTYGEGDAALSALRLLASRDLQKVKLCPACRCRWLYVAKSNYKYCSADCYAEHRRDDPAVRARDAEKQRAYRQRLKNAEAKQDAYRQANQNANHSRRKHGRLSSN